MPNVQTTQGYITDEHGNKKRVRIQKREEAAVLLASGMPRLQIAKQCGVSETTIYKWLKEPAFVEIIERNRDTIAFDAISGVSALVDDSVTTIRKALAQHNDPSLAITVLKELGVLRTTGAKLGMESKAGADNAQGLKVVINVSSDQFNTKPVVVDAECVQNDHNANIMQAPSEEIES